MVYCGITVDNSLNTITMNFPHPIEPRSFNHELIINLEFNFEGNQFKREYYLVTYENGNELIFLTSNELDDCYNQLYLREDFLIFFDINQVIKDFLKIPFMDIYMDIKYHIPFFPYYLYYKPVYVDRKYIENFKGDLIGRLDTNKIPQQDYFIDNFYRWAKTLKIEL